jgi:hypothetical protein
LDIRSFDSIEEAFAFMQRAEQRANAHLAPEQQALTWGSHWIRVYDSLLIVGYCMTEEEMRHDEQEAMGDDIKTPEGQAEFDQNMTRMAESHERGYLFGWAFSVVEPTGELGSSHRGAVWPISEGLFEKLQAKAWDRSQLDTEAKEELKQAYMAWIAHIVSVDQ